jgi:hypothetical protein
MCRFRAWPFGQRPLFVYGAEMFVTWKRDEIEAFRAIGTKLDLPSPTGDSAGCGAKLSVDDWWAACEAHKRDPKKYSIAKLAAHYGVTRNTMHRAIKNERYGNRRSPVAEAEYAAEAAERAAYRRELESI